MQPIMESHWATENVVGRLNGPGDRKKIENHGPISWIERLLLRNGKMLLHPAKAILIATA